MMVERTEYKGNKLIVLKRNEEDKYPFSFGLGKAKLIVENIEEIKKFIEENKQEPNNKNE
jgi:hypothetical protein